MRMNKVLNIIILTFAFATHYVSGIEFNALSIERQEEVVKSLSESISCDIVIMQARADESFRKDAKLSSQYWRTLDIKPLRFICELKGDVRLLAKDVMYIYIDIPDRHFVRYDDFVNAGDAYQYTPLILNDDSMWIAFVEQQVKPKVDRIKIRSTRHKPDMMAFVNDAKQMNAEEFMKRYNIKDTFDECVYEVSKGCAFLIDYPSLEWEETKSMKMNKHLLLPMTEGAKKKRQMVVEKSVSLTREEILEIVFIAYTMDGVNGGSSSEVLSRKVSMLKNYIETNIARKLLKVLIAKKD